MKANLKVKHKKIEEYKEKLEAYPERLYSLIEPTRIFLFQGGEIAETFVYNCLKNLQMIQNNKPPENKSGELMLPERTVNQLQQWWPGFEEELKESEETADNKDIYSRKPFLKYSSDTRTLTIFIPEQKVKKPEDANFNKPSLLLKDKNGQFIRKLELDLFTIKDGLLKTGARDIIFPREQGKIFLGVVFNGEVIIESEFGWRPFYFLKKGKVSDVNPLD